MAMRQCLTMLGAALAALPAAAHAQNVGDNFVVPNLPLDYDRGRNTGVLDRERPEYEAAGLQLGGFVLRPRVDGAAGYTDNVYEAGPRVGDAFFDLAPAAALVSNWARDELALDAGGSWRRYARQSRRDQDGWHVGGQGRYDLGGTGAINVSARTERAAEPATSAAYPGAAAQASQYQITTAQVAPAYAVGRVKLQAAYNFTGLAFDPVTTLSGTVIEQGNRDSQTHSGTARAEYALSPDTSVFVQASYDAVGYSQALAPGVANRDSRGVRVLAGAMFDIASLVRGAVGVGYVERDYASPLYPNIADLTAEVKLDYFVDTLTTLTLTGRRIIEDATFGNVGGYVNSSVALRADHELLRNLLLDLQGAYEHDAFRGAEAHLDIIRVSGGARYMASRALGFGLSLQHDARAAGGAAAAASGLTSYSETRFLLSAVVQR